MLIDTHCHLNFKAFDNDLGDVVRRAELAGVGKIIVPGTDLVSSQKAIDIARRFPNICFAAIGIHPHHLQDPNLKVNDELRKQLESLITQDRVVAVGEIGMDYHHYVKTKYDSTEITAELKLKQKQLLVMQLELALIHNKPVILHCRDAHDDMVQTISSFTKGRAGSLNISRTDSPAKPVKTNYIKPPQFHGVWHCFGGNAKQLQDILTMGYYVGWDGNITYNENQYSPLVSAAPLDRILIETDAPYLAPIPHRGNRNEPAYMHFIAETIAKYHASPLSEVIHLSTKNAVELFSLSE